MDISKFLISSATALGIVGTIGFAVAQTSTTTSDAVANPQASGATNMPANTMPMPSTSPSTSVRPTSPMVNTETSLTPEREARVDRN